MYLKIIVAVIAVTSIPRFSEATSVDHAEDLIAEGILDELEDGGEDNGDVRAAVRYMIPVPIRVVVPVPRQPAPAPPPPPPPPPQPQREPIIAVPVVVSPGPYPSWRPVGPPVLAVPIGGPTAAQIPDDDDNDFERRALAGELRKPQRVVKGHERHQAYPGVHAGPYAHSNPRRARSISDRDAPIKNADVFRRELRLGNLQDSVPAKGIHGVDVPQKVSAKSWRKGFQGMKKAARGHIRRKRQYVAGNNYYPPPRYNQPAPVLVPASAPGPVLVPVQAVPAQVVPVPVIVPVAVGP